MKNLYFLLSIMIFSTIISNIFASYPGGITKRERKDIEAIQKEKLAMQREYTRPSTYNIIDKQITHDSVNWTAIFTTIDSMQGVINVNEYRTSEGETLLELAVRLGNFAAAQTLIKNYNATLDPAILYKRLKHLLGKHVIDPRDWNEILITLNMMQNFINVNEFRAKNNCTLIELAVVDNNFVAVETLLKKYGANPNLFKTHCPLIRAIEDNNPAMVKLLLQYGAIPNQHVPGYQGTAFDWAESKPEILRILNEYKK